MIKVTQAWLCIPPFNPTPLWIVSSPGKEKPWYWNVLVLTDFGRKLAKNLMLTDSLLCRSWIVFRATGYLINEPHLRWIQSFALLFSNMLLQTKRKWNSYPQRRISTPRSRVLPCISHLKKYYCCSLSCWHLLTVIRSVLSKRWVVPSVMWTEWCSPNPWAWHADQKDAPSGAWSFGNLLRHFMVFLSSQSLNNFTVILAII